VTCVPTDASGKSIEGAIAFYTNKKSEVIETSDPARLPVGTLFKYHHEAEELQAGETASGIVEFNGNTFIIGSSCTKGYREYRGLAWKAHVMRPLY
jgi:hypothetical protein